MVKKQNTPIIEKGCHWEHIYPFVHKSATCVFFVKLYIEIYI